MIFDEKRFLKCLCLNQFISLYSDGVILTVFLKQRLKYLGSEKPHRNAISDIWSWFSLSSLQDF